jgi:glutamate:GABA antiporter
MTATRPHPRYRTPINSVFFAASATLVVCVLALLGTHAEEAFSLFQIWGFTLYGLANLAMFAIPLMSGRKLGFGPSIPIKMAACSGFVVTLLFVVLSIFPVIDVANPVSYAWKTIAAVVGITAAGVLLYAHSRRRTVVSKGIAESETA